MPMVYLGLGSNIDPYRSLCAGLDALTERYGELAISPVYESEAVGFDGDPFLNLVVAFATRLPLALLARQLRHIEYEHGRPLHCSKFSPRVLDIDILLYGDCCGQVDGLVLPRREIDRHAHALCPLADLAPHERHPARGLSYRRLWADMARHQGRALTRVPFHWRGRRY